MIPTNYLRQFIRKLRESNRLLGRPARSIRAQQRQAARSRAAIELLEPRQMLVASLAINDASIVEGNSGSSNLNFTVTRSGDDTLSDITVGYNTSDNREFFRTYLAADSKWFLAILADVKPARPLPIRQRPFSSQTGLR